MASHSAGMRGRQWGRRPRVGQSQRGRRRCPGALRAWAPSRLPPHWAARVVRGGTATRPPTL